jgi:hypothetical protein
MIIKYVVCGVIIVIALVFLYIGEDCRRDLKKGGYQGPSGSAKEGADGITGGLMIAGYTIGVLALGLAAFLFTVPAPGH